MTKKLLHTVIVLLLANTLSAQRFSRFGYVPNLVQFYHQQNINYHLYTSDKNGGIFGIQYDTVTSGFNYGHEYAQVRLKVFNGTVWAYTQPIKLFSRHSIDAPRILDIQYYKGAVYICGSFDSSSLNSGAGVVKYSNQQWSSVGIDLKQSFPDYFEVNKMIIYGNELLITGNFDSIPGLRVNGIMLYNGSNWQSLGGSGQKGFQNLSGNSNVFFYGSDSLYVFNKNKIKPDSIEIGGENFKKLGVLRNGKFESITTPFPYIAALCSKGKELIAIPSSNLIYISSLSHLKNNVWVNYNIPDNDSFYATNFIGSHQYSGNVYLFFQKPGNGIKIYKFDGQALSYLNTFKVSENYLALELKEDSEGVILSGNFKSVACENYSDSIQLALKISFRPQTVVNVICFDDANTDGIKQLGEALIKNCRVNEVSGNLLSETNGGGTCNIVFETGQNKTFKISHPFGYYSNVQLKINNSGDSVYHFEVPMYKESNDDVSLFVHCGTGNSAKQGFKTRYDFEFVNKSSTDKNTTVFVRHHASIDQKEFIGFTPMNATKEGFEFTLMVPKNSRIVKEMKCRYAVDSFYLGQTVSIVAYHNSSDNNNKNNSDTLKQKVVSAYDPNIKIAYPSSVVDQNDVIKYAIYFENLGNDTALNVTVIDTIKSKLDLTKIVIGGSSHSYSNFVVRDSFLIWQFNGIKLPPRKADSIHCNGFVTFRINLNSEVKKGDTIYNSAAIYFDYQKPVITNRSTVTFLKKNNLEDVANDKRYVYPNPSNGLLNIGNSQGTYQLYALNGQLLMELKTDQNGSAVLPNDINSGTYILVGMNNGQLIKETLILIR